MTFNIGFDLPKPETLTPEVAQRFAEIETAIAYASREGRFDAVSALLQCLQVTLLTAILESLNSVRKGEWQ